MNAEPEQAQVARHRGDRSTAWTDRSAHFDRTLLGVAAATVGIVAIGFATGGAGTAALLGIGPLVAAIGVYIVARRDQTSGTESPSESSHMPPQGTREWAADAIVASAGPGPRRAIGYFVLDPAAEDHQFDRRSDELETWCLGSGLKVKSIVHDTEAPGEQRARPALQWALAQIAERKADTLVVIRLQDLSGSIASLSPLLRWFADGERTLIATDFKLDTSTSEGRLAADALAGVGSWERDRISARTRRGLDAARSRGAGRGGATIADLPELHDRVARMRRDGMTLQAIADVLNEEGVPTLRGGAMWRPSSVQRAAGYQRPAASGADIELPGPNPGRRRPYA